MGHEIAAKIPSVNVAAGTLLLQFKGKRITDTGSGADLLHNDHSFVFAHILTDLRRVQHDALKNKVDAVFLKTEVDKTDSLGFVQMLRRQKSDLPVFIISQTEDLREEAAEAGANDYFVQPVTEQQLRDAIQSVKNKENAS